MDLTALFDTLTSTQIPALPSLALMRMARYQGWAIVLACIVLWVGVRWPRWLQRGLAALLFVWVMLPGPVSPAFWLGQAFQMPSLMTILVCGVYLVLILKTGSFRVSDPAQGRVLQWTSLCGIVLGWLLLLDTFAVFPLSLYSAGFSPAATGVAALLAALPWMIFGPQHPWRVVSYLLGVVLLLYVLLRLPTGNLWDALLDPLLWIALQLSWLVRGVRRINAAWRGPKATRA